MLLLLAFQASMFVVLCLLSRCPSTKGKDHTLPVKGAIDQENGSLCGSVCSLLFVFEHLHTKQIISRIAQCKLPMGHGIQNETLALCRCADTFLGQCLPFMLALATSSPGIVCPTLEQSEALQELFTSNLKLGLPTARQAAKQLLVLLYQQGSSRAKQGLVALIKERVLYCIHHHRSLDMASSMQQELGLLTELVTGASNADAQAWQSQMLLLFQLLLPATGNPQECLTMLHHRCMFCRFAAS